MSRGHRYGDIVSDYSLDQIHAFYEAAICNREQELLEEASFVSTAYHTDERGWKVFLRELEYQKVKRKSIEAAREGRPVPVNVQGIEKLLQGK